MYEVSPIESRCKKEKFLVPPKQQILIHEVTVV